MNKYSSMVKRVIARRVAYTSVALNPPDDILSTVWNYATRLFTLPVSKINPQTLINIRGIGAFCNFADGLVWGNSNVPITINLVATPYSRSATIGDLTCTKGNDIISVDTSLLVANDIIATVPPILPGINLTEGQYLEVGTIISPAAFSARELPWKSQNTVPAYKLNPITVSGVAIRDYSSTFLVSTFNEMYDADEALAPSSFISTASALTPITDIMITAAVTVNTTLYTRSISTAFAGTTPFIDVIADLEFTAQNSVYR